MSISGVIIAASKFLSILSSSKFSIYFLKYLKPEMSAWDFEVRNNYKAQFDGANIIANDYVYPQFPHTFSNLNLYSKGKLTIDKDGHILDNQPSSRYFDKKDLKYI